MTLYSTILKSDEDVLKETSTYSKVYSIVKEFVDKYNLNARQKGSILEYWVNITCKDDKPGPNAGYFFSAVITDHDLTDQLTLNIINYFKSGIDDILNSNCVLEIGKGLG